MKTWLKVTLTSTQAITVGRGVAKAFHSPSMPYIPGSTLRGAIAAAYTNAGQKRDDTFREIFDGKVRFGPLLRSDALLDSLSVVRCKYHDFDANHPPFTDRAFLGGDVKVPSGCGGTKQEELKGGFRSTAGGGLGLSSRTSTAMHPLHETAKAGSLYSRESHAPGTHFVGYIVGDDQHVNKLEQFKRLVVGGRQSVLGAASVDWETLANAPHLPTSPGQHTVVLRAIAPIIAVDRAGRPHTDFREILREVGGITVDALRVWADRSTTQGVSGWHAASQLPKPGEVAISQGAVASVSGDVESLRRLLDEGIGLRRAEGFGFLEIVPEAWKVETAPPAPGDHRHNDGVPAMLDALIALGLDPPQRRWVANALREASLGANELLARPGAQTLSGPQKATIAQILKHCPTESRHALATAVRNIP